MTDGDVDLAFEDRDRERERETECVCVRERKRAIMISNDNSTLFDSSTKHTPICNYGSSILCIYTQEMCVEACVQNLEELVLQIRVWFGISQIT